MLDVIQRRIGSTPLGQGIGTFLNPFSYLKLRDHRAILERFDRIYIDGVLLQKGLSLVGIPSERVSMDMSSLAPRVLGDASQRGLTVALVGGEPGVADAARRHLVASYPDLQIPEVSPGFFECAEARATLLAHLVDASPDVVLVGMGAVLQERLLLDLCDAGWRGIGYTCGAFLHQTARKGVRYYPNWVDRSDLRWLYRMADEPRLVGRYFLKYPRAGVAFAADWWSFRSKGGMR